MSRSGVAESWGDWSLWFSSAFEFSSFSSNEKGLCHSQQGREDSCIIKMVIDEDRHFSPDGFASKDSWTVSDNPIFCGMKWLYEEEEKNSKKKDCH